MAIENFFVPETPQQPQDTDTAAVEFFFVYYLTAIGTTETYDLSR